MALNIKDPETELLVRILARRRGISLTEAIRQAVRGDVENDSLPENEKVKRVARGLHWLEAFDRKYGGNRAGTITEQEKDDIINRESNGEDLALTDVERA